MSKIQKIGGGALEFYMRRFNSFYFRNDSVKVKLTIDTTSVKKLDRMKKPLKYGEKYDAVAELI